MYKIESKKQPTSFISEQLMIMCTSNTIFHARDKDCNVHDIFLTNIILWSLYERNAKNCYPFAYRRV